MINIIGCGPGSKDHLTAAAGSIIDDADILIGAQHLLDLSKNESAEKIAVTAHIDDALSAIKEKHGDGKKVAVLVSGDPGIFSLSRRVIEAFGLENCRVTPGISSVQTAFARIGMNWNDAMILSAHHNLPDIENTVLDSAGKIALLSGRDDVIDWIQALLDRTCEDFTVYACENLTLDNEKVTRIAAEGLKNRNFASRCVFLLIRKGIE